MNFLVVGCGSIGQRHIRNLKSLGTNEVMGVETSPTRREEVGHRYGIRVWSSLEEGLARQPKAVIICTPSSLHLPIALQVARAGCHFLIEKPLSHSLEGVDELLQLVKKNKLVTLLGCNWKFHPSFKLMKELLERKEIGRVLSSRCQFGYYLPYWPKDDYRKSYSAQSALGGGVLLDSHELDYIMWFLGDLAEIFCFSNKLSRLEIDTEDVVEIVLKFKQGAIGEIHLDYIQRKHQSNYEFLGEEGTIKWDFAEKAVKIFQAGDKEWRVYREPPSYELNQMYLEEMKHFAECLEGQAEPITDVHRAAKVLKLILAAKESSRTGKVVKVG